MNECKVNSVFCNKKSKHKQKSNFILMTANGY